MWSTTFIIDQIYKSIFQVFLYLYIQPSIYLSVNLSLFHSFHVSVSRSPSLQFCRKKLDQWNTRFQQIFLEMLQHHFQDTVIRCLFDVFISLIETRIIEICYILKQKSHGSLLKTGDQNSLDQILSKLYHTCNCVKTYFLLKLC